MSRKALLSYGARFNSTVVWTDAIAQKPVRIRNPKKLEDLYAPDLSYLKKAPKSLAGKLAFGAAEKKIDVAAITQKRIEARLSRFQKRVTTITQKRVEARLGRQFNEKIRDVEDNVERLDSLGLLNSPGPLPPLARSARRNVNLDSFLDSPAQSHVEIPDHKLSPSALKRRQERRLRESGSRQYPKFKEEIMSDNMEIEPDTTNSEELEDVSPIPQAPEFDGPPIYEILDDDFGIIQYHPLANGHDSVDASKSPSYRLNPNLIDSLVGGDYSQYTSLSSSVSNSASRKALSVVNTAELVLSHQRDYIIPQRKKVIEIVKNLAEGKKIKS